MKIHKMQHLVYCFECNLLIITALTMGQLSQNNFRKIAIIFLPIILNMCYGCSKEPSHRDGSFEYPQHMFWLRIKKKVSVTHSDLFGGLVKWLIS